MFLLVLMKLVLTTNIQPMIQHLVLILYFMCYVYIRKRNPAFFCGSQHSVFWGLQFKILLFCTESYGDRFFTVYENIMSNISGPGQSLQFTTRFRMFYSDKKSLIRTVFVWKSRPWAQEDIRPVSEQVYIGQFLKLEIHVLLFLTE